MTFQRKFALLLYEFCCILFEIEFPLCDVEVETIHVSEEVKILQLEYPSVILRYMSNLPLLYKKSR